MRSFRHATLAAVTCFLAACGGAISESEYADLSRANTERNTERYRTAETELRRRGYAMEPPPPARYVNAELQHASCIALRTHHESAPAPDSLVQLRLYGSIVNGHPEPALDVEVALGALCDFLSRRSPQLETIIAGERVRIAQTHSPLARDTHGNFVSVLIRERIVGHRTVVVDRSCGRRSDTNDPVFPPDAYREDFLNMGVVYIQPIGDFPTVELPLETEQLDLECNGYDD